MPMHKFTMLVYSANLRNKTNKRCPFVDSCLVFIISQMLGFENVALEMTPCDPFDLYKIFYGMH